MKVIETMQVNRNTIRTVYRYKGITMMHDYHTPYNVFKPTKECVVFDLNLERAKYPELELIELYCEETHGSPILYGDNSLEQAKKMIDEGVFKI